MPKPLVFISHIGAERNVATAFKELIEKVFLGMIEVFVSSDDTSIQMGSKWLSHITSALQKCVIEIIVVSPRSVGRPWINFEAGAGWVRDIPVIPLCHSGMTAGKLPVPLSMLHAANATDAAALSAIFPVLAKALDCRLPHIDFDPFIQIVGKCEADYLFRAECNRVFDLLRSIAPDVVTRLAAGKTVNCWLPPALNDHVSAEYGLFAKYDILLVRRPPVCTCGSVPSLEVIFEPRPGLIDVLADPRLKP